MDLKRGSSGPEVANWQRFLTSQGFAVDVDGDFGPATEAATRGFQKTQNLRGDGIVGTATRAAADKLKSASKPAAAGGSKQETAPAPAKTRAKRTVLVSAGHTNDPKNDRGAVGNGFIEGNETVKVRDRTAEILRGLGVTVLEDGADGVSEPRRKSIALIPRADLAIDIHFNAGPPAANGIEVLSKPRLKKTAQRIAGAIAEATGLKLRGEAGWKADNSGQHHRLTFCEAGGLIVEICFISNARDMSAYELRFEALCQKLAEALA